MRWAVAKSPAPTEDRVLTLDLGEAWVFAVVDGAGGMGGSARAADVVASTIEALARRADPSDLADPGFWCVVLAECDAAALRDEAAGQAAAAVLCVTEEGTCGASVGDCRIWARAGSEALELTGSQRRRPMLGDGGATPWPLDARPQANQWVLATDGVDVFGAGARARRDVARVWCAERARRWAGRVGARSWRIWRRRGGAGGRAGRRLVCRASGS